MNTNLTTASGRTVDLLAPRAEDIDWGDVAEQLAKENRYNGATPGRAYSVAEHLSRGALAVYAALEAGDHQSPTTIKPEVGAKYFLLHDMPEAFLKDDTTPKKRAVEAIAVGQFGVLAGAVNAAFAALTERFELAIAVAAGVPWPPHPDIARLVARYDRIMLNTEWRDLMPVPHPWPVEPSEAPSAGMRIEPWGWQQAKSTLLADCRRWLPGARRQGRGDST